MQNDDSMARLVDNLARHLWRMDGKRSPNHRPYLDEAKEQASEVREAMMSVESLGGSLIGCEVGTVQRLFGAEPLGLLRWSEMTEKHLINALRARFEGVGLAENTEIFIRPDKHHPEYRTRDKRYFMEMHSFVRADEMSHDAFAATAYKRLTFLRDKLVEDLKFGSKLFVFKLSGRSLPERSLEDIRDAMSLIGDNTLLYVTLAEKSDRPGSVVRVKDGLLIGYIDRFAAGRYGEDLGANPDGWLAVLREGVKLWRGK